MANDGPAAHVKRASTARELRRLDAERATLTAVRHPNMVELIGDHHAPGELATVLAGRTDLAQRPPRDAGEVRRFGASICAAVADLHDMGVVHGAIEPSHCIVAPAGRIVLCSFGSARITHASGATDRAVTPAEARCDVEAIRSMLQSWRDSAAADEIALGRAARHQLDSAIAVLARPTALASDALQALDSNAAPTRRPRRQRTAGVPASEERPTPVKRERAIRPALLRLGCALATIAAITLIDVEPEATGVSLATGGVVAGGLVVLRLVALVSAAYLAGVSSLALAAQITGRGLPARIAHRLAPGWLWMVAAGATAVSVTGLSTSDRFTPGDGPTPTMLSEPRQPTLETPDPDVAAALSTTTAVPLTSTSTVSGSGEPNRRPIWARPDDSETHAAGAVAKLRTWTVRPGDHMWRIAEQTLTASNGQIPSDREIDKYWRRLVDANRGRLVDAANPDLIYVDQVFDLPPVP